MPHDHPVRLACSLVLPGVTHKSVPLDFSIAYEDDAVVTAVDTPVLVFATSGLALGVAKLTQLHQIVTPDQGTTTVMHGHFLRRWSFEDAKVFEGMLAHEDPDDADLGRSRY